MREILADLVAEQQGLDQFLQTIDYRKWSTPSLAPGWDVRDQVSHLASTEELAFRAIDEGAPALDEMAATFSSIDEFNKSGVKEGRAMRPQQVIEWWRQARAKVVDELSRMKGTERTPWVTGDMSAKTFATARLMETWAHGLDIHGAVGAVSEDTTRLRHVAFLGWKSLPWAFQVAGEDYPEPVRLELKAPEYQKWIYGPEESENVIRGHAGDWCRVAVRRIKAADTSLEGEGEVAEQALLLARAYA